MTRHQQIAQAKLDSFRTENTTLVVQDNRNREFFRLEKGEMVEYDATKLNGLRVKLTDEELDTIDTWGYQE